MDMSQFAAAWTWFANQNIAVQAVVIVGILNIFIAGAKQMGWTYLADECLKIENAIKAMIDTAKAQVFGQKTPPTPPAGS